MIEPFELELQYGNNKEVLWGMQVNFACSGTP